MVNEKKWRDGRTRDIHSVFMKPRIKRKGEGGKRDLLMGGWIGKGRKI